MGGGNLKSEMMSFAPNDKVEIVRGLIQDMRSISKIYSNGTLLLDKKFLGRRKIILSDNYTTKGFRKGYLGSKHGMTVSIKKIE